jgi:hypothetical protein
MPLSQKKQFNPSWRFAGYETCRRKLITKIRPIVCGESNVFVRASAEMNNIKPTISRTTNNHD